MSCGSGVWDVLSHVTSLSMRYRSQGSFWAGMQQERSLGAREEGKTGLYQQDWPLARGMGWVSQKGIL